MIDARPCPHVSGLTTAMIAAVEAGHSLVRAPPLHAQPEPDEPKRKPAGKWKPTLTGRQSQRAAELLRRLLADGPRLRADIAAAATEAGVSFETVSAVARVLAVARTPGAGRSSIWSLEP